MILKHSRKEKVTFFSFLDLLHGMFTMFAMTSFARNRREEVIDGPILIPAGIA